MFTKRLHVFKAGTQTSAQGVERNFSPKELEEVVQSYNPGTHEAPVVIGHSGDNDSAPSFGWIKKFVRNGDDLYADVSFTDVAKDLVKDGHYRKVSISFYSPSSPINPHKGKWSARHLALLGASPPAVKGLEPFSFSESGVFDFATELTADNLFDLDLGPTMIEEKSPLEILKERLDEVRGEVSDSLKQLKENQDKQSQVEVGDKGEAPEMPSQQFSELKKKVSESSQKLANLETMFPSDSYDEGVKRVTAKGSHGQESQVVEQVFDEGVKRVTADGAHGHKVQVVEEVFEESSKEGVSRKVSDGAHGHKVQVVEQVFEEMPFKRKKSRKIKGLEEEMTQDTEYKERKPSANLLEGEESSEEEEPKRKSKVSNPEMDVEDESEEFKEGSSHKATKDGKVSFGTHAEKDLENPAGRGSTGKSLDDSYADRQAVGKGEEDGREKASDDAGEQDKSREKTASSTDQDESREKLAKASPQSNSDAESRWAEQPGAKDRASNANQYDPGDKDLPERSKPGISDGDEPHGRDGGPTKVSEKMEEEPSNMEIAVPLESTKGNKKARVLHQESGDRRAPLKGGDIADHVEGVSHKTTRDGKVSFSHHPEKEGDPTKRAEGGKGEDDTDSRQVVARADEEDREGVTKDNKQDADRVKTSKHSEQDADRVKTASSPSDDRWDSQSGGSSRAMNNDQFDDGEEGLPDGVKPGISNGKEPYGRDGGPTEIPTIVEEEPSNEEIAVPLKNVKQSASTRVMYQKSGDKRASVKGGAIVDHAEGEADGLTREPKKGKVSNGTDPRGRDNGPTKFPTKSEEEPDNLEMAVDLEDSTKSKKVRVLRQKSGDMPSLDHKEKARTPMTKTGKGSTYGQKTPVLVEEETEETFKETEEFSGMGSLGQAKPKGFPTAMYEELKALKAENDRLKKEYEEGRIRARKAKISEFIEGLYNQGKLTDGVIAQSQLQNYCEGLEFGTLEFAEGESPITTLFSLLDRLPNLVHFGEVVSNSPFQDPEDDNLDPHEKAMKMVANGEASDYVEAIKRCIPWGAKD